MLIPDETVSLIVAHICEKGDGRIQMGKTVIDSEKIRDEAVVNIEKRLFRGEWLMKKDKEWLKERVMSELEVWDGSEPGWSKDAIITISDLIDQLEEPENPVIPQYVADWIEYRRKDFHSGYEAVSYIYNFGWDDETRVEFDIYNWIKDKDKQRLFIEAFEDGYDIKKEKRYRLRLIAPILSEDKYLNKIAGTGYYMVSSYSNIENAYQTIFTESELEQMDETGFERELVEE